MVSAALTEFTAAWNEIPENATNYLKDLYIFDNPHPTGSKDNYYAAPDGSTYSAVHAKYHPYFRTVLRDRGDYDIFLFDMTDVRTIKFDGCVLQGCQRFS